MSANSSIEWTDRTWNPTTGCDKVSPGCANCYAVRDARRLSGNPNPTVAAAAGGTTVRHANGKLDWSGVVNLHEDRLQQPLAWRKPQRVFVNSMSDLFHESVPEEFIDKVFAVMALAPQHTFQILTKRADRMRAYMTELDRAMRLPSTSCERWRSEAEAILSDRDDTRTVVTAAWPLPNVWMGVSVEDQTHADARIPLLLQTPAAVRFISAEPLLGPLDLEAVPIPAPGAALYGLRGVAQPIGERDSEPDDWKYWMRRGAKLDWVIVGGESGHGARPCALEWIKAVVSQCQAASVPVFVKQLGAYVVSEERTCDQEIVDLLKPRLAERMVKAPNGEYWAWRAGTADGKGGDPSEWPEDLRVREFPEVRQ